MLSLFEIGGTYRERYRVEHVVRFFDGELAIAGGGAQRVYLQSAALCKQAPSRAVQQYRALDHPLLLPYSEVYTEDRAIVWIRPYEPIHPLREVISSREVDEDQAVKWVRQLLRLEMELNDKPMPMYLLLDPRNIGLNEQGELRVLFCGIRDVTAQPQLLDWGSFFYSLLSGRHLEEPIRQLPAELPVSRPMAQLIRKSLDGAKPEDVLARIDWYERKKHGKGLFGLLFGQGKRDEGAGESSAVSSSTDSKASGSASTVPPEEKLSSSQKLTRPLSTALEAERPGTDASGEDGAKAVRMKELAEELERTGRQLLQRQREELERRQRERLESQREEFRKREQELLKKQEEEFRKASVNPLSEEEKLLDEAENRESEGQKADNQEFCAGWEPEEQERIRREQESLLRKELEELRNQRREWERKYRELERKEQELREKLEREFEQMARELLKRQEEEFERRERELLRRQRLWLEEQTRRRLEEHRKELEQETRRYVPVRPAAPAEEISSPGHVRDDGGAVKAPAKDRLTDEKRERENRHHEELARQFEEYMKLMYRGE